MSFIYKLLKAKFSEKFIKYPLTYKNNLVDESIKNSITAFIKEYIIDDFMEEFQSLLQEFIKKEKHFVKELKTTNYQYFKLSYLFKLLTSAKNAIKTLEDVNSTNRKISYYEEGKNATLESLINEYTSQLNEPDYKRHYSIRTKREIQVKRIIAKLQKNKSLYFNFHIVLGTTNTLENFKYAKDNDTNILLKSLFEFYRVGHATPNQIYKSLAIQIYHYYKDDFKDNELKAMISKLITAFFNLNSYYSNFNNIEQQPYIKNCVYDFVIFSCDNKKLEQQRKVIYKMMMSNQVFPRYIFKFIRKSLYYNYFYNLLPYYQDMATLNFFGFSKKKN